MNTLIIEYPNSITELLCDNIIENYEINEKSIFEIPKNNEKWTRIEKLLYKELLININKYKNSILHLNTVDSINILNLISKPLFTNSFLINKLSSQLTDGKLTDGKQANYFKKNNRYNVLSYIFYLNTVTDGGEIHFVNGAHILPKKGKLVLFPENLDYMYKPTIPISNDQYIIYGQLCNDNII